MPDILIAGFQHETNTFGLTKADYQSFLMADTWPHMLTGPDVIEGTRGLNIPIAGFAAAALALPEVVLKPVLWCAAEPSAEVTDDAFERISQSILDGVGSAGHIDGIYLDLHGAMVTESFEDGEGELLQRVRTLVGHELPVVISLDMHANVTRQMVDLTNRMAIYRTYPHLDMAATGARCLPMLLECINGGKTRKAYRQVPYLIPLSSQYTSAEPCRSLYATLDQFDTQRGESAEIAVGFTASDIHDAGPSIVAYAGDQIRADEIADQLLDDFMKAEHQFDTLLHTPLQAAELAMANKSEKPVVLADVQDNPGAGGTSDTTGLLFALHRSGAKRVIMGLMCDPDMAAKTHEAGSGASIRGKLGGRSGIAGEQPFEADFLVERLSQGKCRYTGQMYGGGISELGPSAVLKIIDGNSDIRIVVTTNRSQCLDIGLFTHFGPDPRDFAIVCVKSTVHFRADFDPIASKTLNVAAPGAFICELEKIPYKRLRKGMRLAPGGKPHMLQNPSSHSSKISQRHSGGQNPAM